MKLIMMILYMLINALNFASGSWDVLAKKQNEKFNCHNDMMFRKEICPISNQVKYLYHTTKSIEWLFANNCPVSAYKMSKIQGRDVTHPGSKRDIQRGGGYFFYWRLLSKKKGGIMVATITMRGRYMLLIKKEAIFQVGSFIQGVDAMGCTPMKLGSKGCEKFEKYDYDVNGGMSDGDFCSALNDVFSSSVDHDEGGFFGGLNPGMIDMIICDNSYQPSGGCLTEKAYLILVNKAREGFISKYKKTHGEEVPKFMNYFNVKYFVSSKKEMSTDLTKLLNVNNVVVNHNVTDNDDLGGIELVMNKKNDDGVTKLKPDFE